MAITPKRLFRTQTQGAKSALFAPYETLEGIENLYRLEILLYLATPDYRRVTFWVEMDSPTLPCKIVEVTERNGTGPTRFGELVLLPRRGIVGSANYGMTTVVD